MNILNLESGPTDTNEIFRLGDIINYGDDQINELIEQMNSSN